MQVCKAVTITVPVCNDILEPISSADQLDLESEYMIFTGEGQGSFFRVLAIRPDSGHGWRYIRTTLSDEDVMFSTRTPDSACLFGQNPLAHRIVKI